MAKPKQYQVAELQTDLGTIYAQANAAYSQANAASSSSNTANLLAGGTISGDLTVTGNLVISGNTTTLNTETIVIEDNEIVLNSNVAGAPTLNSGIIVNRGSSTNTFLRWNESTDKWGWSDDGSAFVPFANAVLKTGDTMTGQLNISAGGLLVTGGNVGIGTNSPSSKLVVKTATNENLEIRSASVLGSYSGVALDALNDARSSVVDLVMRGTNLTLLGSGSTSMFFQTNSTERMRLDNNGALHINNPGTNYSNAKLIIAAAGTANTETVALKIKSSNGNATGFEIVANTTSEYYRIQNWYAYPLAFGTSNTERMRIDGSGNVGIGTTSPANKLSINQGSSPTAGLLISGTSSPGMLITETGGSVSAQFANDTSGSYFGTSTNHPLILRTNLTERMRIGSDGRIGIGAATSTRGLLYIESTLNTTTANAALAIYMPGISAGTAGPQYGIDIESGGFNNSSPVIGIRVRTKNQLSGSYYAGSFYSETVYSASYGIYVEGAQLDTNGAGSMTAIYAKCTGTGAGDSAAVTGLRVEQAATRGSVSRGLYVTTVAGPASIIPFQVDHAGTERARINSSGSFLFGQTGEGFQNSNSMTIQPSVGYAVWNHANGTADGTKYHWFGYNAGNIGSITQNGTTAVAYNTTSDYRLKNITGPIQNSGSYIDSLKPVEGTWKVDGSTFVGLIAHEVQEVSRTKVATGTKDGDEIQGMDYSSAEIIANLIAEIQSLRVRVAELESK